MTIGEGSAAVGRNARHAARQVALLFAGSGLLAFAAAARPMGSPALNAIGAADLVIAALIWVLPWHRWPHVATLAVVAPALLIIGLADRYGGATPYTYPLFFIVLFVWIGVAQPPRTAIWLAAPAVIAYLLPLQASTHAATAGESVIVAIPVCVMIAELLARAMAKIRASEQKAQRRAELLGLIAASSDAISSLSSEAVLDTVAEAVIRVGYDGTSVNLIEDDGRTFTVRHAVNLPEMYVRAAHPVQSGMVGVVGAEKRTTVVADYRSHPKAIATLKEAGVRSTIGVPLWVDNHVAGVLLAVSHSVIRPMTEEIEALEVLAGFAGRALENARRYAEQVRLAEESSRASVTDDLTGTGNRRLANRLLDSLRPGDALIIADLDHFKKINDTYGHQAGDRVLIELGEYLRTSLRQGDGVARYGGEEFVIVVRKVEDPQAIADRLVKGWTAWGPATTLSAGIAMHEAGVSPALTLAAADEALYCAKDRGRDCAVSYPFNAA